MQARVRQGAGIVMYIDLRILVYIAITFKISSFNGFIIRSWRGISTYFPSDRPYLQVIPGRMRDM